MDGAAPRKEVTYQLFIWDFVADVVLGQIIDWIYSQTMGFLGNFFSEMGGMGVELFEMPWVLSLHGHCTQSVW